MAERNKRWCSNGFGIAVKHLPVTIERLSGNGSFISPPITHSFARDIGLKPRKTPSRVHKAIGWPKPSFARSNAITFASAGVRLLEP